MNEVRMMSGVTTTSGGVIGDPWIMSIAGHGDFFFHGKDGEFYSLLDGKGIFATMRVASVEALPYKTYQDVIDVKAANHRVTMTLDGSTLDGKPLVQGDPHLADDLIVWSHTGAGGEPRIDLTYQDWRLAILYDDGTDPELHGGKELDGIPHLAFFVDSRPDDLEGSRVC